jgi:hypothetical protein
MGVEFYNSTESVGTISNSTSDDFTPCEPTTVTLWME